MPSGDDVLVIDLGDREWSGRDPARSRWPSRLGRWIGLLVAVATVFPVTGSARREAAMTAPLWAVDEPGSVIGDRVYTLGGSGEVTSRSVLTGAANWRLAGDGAGVTLTEGDHRVRRRERGF